MIQFESPIWFWLFLVIVPIAVFLIWEFREKSRDVTRVGGENSPRAVFSQCGKGLVWAILVSSLVFALVNPQIVRTKHFLESYSQAQVAAVFDVSRSMAAREDPDSPNRLARSRELFLEALPHLAGSEIALYAFTDVFLSHLPFTANHSLVHSTLEHAVVIESLPIPGSDLGEVLEEISQKFDPAKEEKVIILFSDGEFTKDEDFPPEIFENMAQEGITLVVVGVGETDGATIPQFDEKGVFTGFYVLSKETGMPHVSYLDEENLKDLAFQANGHYFNERDLVDITSFLEDSIEINITETEQTVDHFTDLYPWFVVSLFAGFVLLVKFHN